MEPRYPPEKPLLRMGNTCSAVGLADRAAVLIDNEAYFSAAAAAIRNARHSIWVLGWEFDPRTALEPTAASGERDDIGEVLKQVAEERPDIRVRVLIWNAALPLSAGDHLVPQRAKFWFDSSPVEFRLDPTVPKGAVSRMRTALHLAQCARSRVTLRP